MKRKESMLLGEILRKTGVSLAVYGIDVEQLAEGGVKVSYEEMQYVLKDNPTTHMLAVNLKEELPESKLWICIIYKPYYSTIAETVDMVCRIGGRKAL